MKLLKEQLPGVKALFMIVSKEEEELYRELSHGAQDYILKSVNVKDLMDAISQAAAGEKVIPSSEFRLTAS
jgi:DNA-binding NarL/FixJ family response regulator